MSELKQFEQYLKQVSEGKALTVHQAEEAFQAILSGDIDPIQLSAFLIALKVRGEHVDEITGAVKVMRRNMVKMKAPSDAIDIVGTGGDGASSYNISTATAILVASCGVSVAKHGNRSVSSRSGAADVLEALGLNLDQTPEQIERSIAKNKLGFMFAPQFHSAMRHVAPVRKALGVRTLFNLLGPLSNPASVQYYLMGVYDKKWLIPMAKTLKNLRAKRALIVHGADGMDEITLCERTYCTELKDGVIISYEISPEDAGLQETDPENLIGGDAQENAKALMSVLNNEPSSYRDTVLMNSAAALMVVGKVENLKQGVEMAKKSLEEGKAKATLEKLVKGA